MRLVSWNCKGAFRRKFPLAEGLDPDLLVVPECEDFGSTTQTFGAKPLRSHQWVGDNSPKGLSVFAFGEYSFEIHPAYEPKHHWILPVKVSGPLSFTLIAAWTVPSAKSKSYVEQLDGAFEAYAELHAAGAIIWAGDFNANFCFDRPSRPYKFSDFVAKLSATNTHSLYHRANNCAHGQEIDKTFYMYHKAERGHHIDYLFGGSMVHARPHTITLGDCGTWMKHSDHVPLILDVPDRGPEVTP